VIDFADLSASSSAAAAPKSGGMGAVFDSLRTTDVTAGLKKVTSDMKTKNLKDKPVLEAKAKQAAGSSAPAKAASH